MAARPSRQGRHGGRKTHAGPPHPRLKVWVVFPDGTKLGGGRARLFELIDQLGSIRSAVTQMGMSYRGAWGYISELEAAAGFRFLTRRPGGAGTGGARLTKEARVFLARYRRFRDALEPLAERRFRRAFKAP
jgi:molybdate transport system regulatory protein